MSCLLLGGCMTKKELTLYKDSSFDSGFDTVIYFNAYMESEKEFNEAFTLVQDQFSYYNALFDKYHDYEGINNIKTINDNAGIAPVKVDEPILEMLLLSKQYSELSDNQFDITIGPVLEIWHEVREAANNNEPYILPTEEELNNAYACSGWDKVEIDEKNSTVYLNNSCAALDVGSVAKGFTAEKVSQMLMENGVESGILNAGGNVRTIGSKQGNDWIAGIQTPEILNLSDYLMTLPISENRSLVTSGDYQRYFVDNDTIYHHIIDPDTLYPAKHANSVSVLSSDSGIADICSTMLFTLSYLEGKELVDKMKAQGIDISVVWIYKDTSELENFEDEILVIKPYYVMATEDIYEQIQLAK